MYLIGKTGSSLFHGLSQSHVSHGTYLRPKRNLQFVSQFFLTKIFSITFGREDHLTRPSLIYLDLFISFTTFFTSKVCLKFFLQIVIGPREIRNGIGFCPVFSPGFQRESNYFMTWGITLCAIYSMLNILSAA